MAGADDGPVHIGRSHDATLEAIRSESLLTTLYIFLALVLVVCILTVVPTYVRRHRAGYRILPRWLDKSHQDYVARPYDVNQDPRVTGAKLAPPDEHDAAARAKTGF